jgi:hypothetical protein
VRPGVCTIQALTNPKEHRDAIVAFFAIIFYVHILMVSAEGILRRWLGKIITAFLGFPEAHPRKKFEKLTGGWHAGTTRTGMKGIRHARSA